MDKSTLNSPVEALTLWDASALTRAVGNNPEVHKRLLGKYLSTARTTMEGITANVARDDWLAAAELAHRLKSASRSVGAMRLGALCEALEKEWRAANGQACRDLTERISLAFENVEAMISAHL